MTYGLLLLLFVGAPIVALAALLGRARRRAHGASGGAWRRAAAVTLLLLMGVATAYTFPWDNHLIATGVWWYNPALVSGIAISHVPLEELLFFPLQTLLVGLWGMWMTQQFEAAAIPVSGGARQCRANGWGRRIVPALGTALWLLGALVLLTGWRHGVYLGWELVWAIPPLLLQALVGGDILWSQRRLIVGIIAPVTLYLSCVDALAIHMGIWTISPRQSLSVLLFGALPIEELLFFTLTTTLVACGLVLGIATESRQRIRALYAGLRGYRAYPLDGRFQQSPPANSSAALDSSPARQASPGEPHAAARSAPPAR